MAMTVEDSEGVFGASQIRRAGKRTTNYTEAEDVALVKAWEGVTLTGNNQTGKGYWRRIADRFYRLMPEPSPRSLRSLQGRFIMIKQSCSRWSGCLEQVRNDPPNGCTVDDYDGIAQERYKQMVPSKGKEFVFQHCWKLLEHSEKWKLRDQEGPPSKKRRSNSPANDLDDDDVGVDDDDGEETPAPAINIGRPDEMWKENDNLKLIDQEGPPPTKMRSNSPNNDLDDDFDDNDDDDDDSGGGSEETPAPDGRRKRKDNMKKTEMENMREKIDELMNARKEMAAEALQMKKELAEKKRQDKMTTWQQIREMEEKKMAVEKRKMDLEERRLLLEENKFQQETVGEEDRIMMMDLNGTDEQARAYWAIRRAEILQSKLRAAGMRGGGSASGGGDGSGGAA